MTMDVVKKVVEEEYSIKPQAVTPAIDTSSWPLLLKNYDKRTWKVWKKMNGRLTFLDSACADWSLHPDPQWLLPIEARHQVVH